MREIWSPLTCKLINTNSTIPDNTTHAPSATTSGFSGSPGSPTVVLLQAEYDRLHQLESSQNHHSATHTSSSGMNPYIASSSRPWVLDSGTSYHMTGIKISLILCIYQINFLLLTSLMVHSLVCLVME